MKKLILLGMILMGLAVYGSMQAVNYISQPAICADCHGSPYQNYTAIKGSILPSHANNSVTCIACHSGKGIQGRLEALKTVANAKIVKDTNLVINQLFRANFSSDKSFNTTMFSSLSANCEKCHPNSDLKGEMHANKTACSLCHFAHTKQKINFEALGILTHKNLKCTACHGTGTELQIPSCTKCHEPHLKGAGWDNAVCLGCHNDAHVPTRKITFTESPPKEWCQGCHPGEYQNLTSKGGKHKQFASCTACHPAHGSKKSCWDCHGGALRDDPHIAHKGNDCNNCHSHPIIIFERGCATCHDPHNPFGGLPRPATDQQISEIAKQRIQNLKTSSPARTPNPDE
jgi:hypothetical protein